MAGVTMGTAFRETETADGGAMKRAMVAAAIFMVIAGAVQGHADCISCHRKLLRQKVTHQPVTTDCYQCHVSKSSQHPVIGSKTHELLAPTPSLCFKCHKPFTKKLHQPVREGKCAACHQVHGSLRKGIIRNDL